MLPHIGCIRKDTFLFSVLMSIKLAGVVDDRTYYIWQQIHGNYCCIGSAWHNGTLYQNIKIRCLKDMGVGLEPVTGLLNSCTEAWEMHQKLFQQKDTIVA